MRKDLVWKKFHRTVQGHLIQNSLLAAFFVTSVEMWKRFCGSEWYTALQLAFVQGKWVGAKRNVIKRRRKARKEMKGRENQGKGPRQKRSCSSRWKEWIVLFFLASAFSIDDFDFRRQQTEGQIAFDLNLIFLWPSFYFFSFSFYLFFWFFSDKSLKAEATQSDNKVNDMERKMSVNAFVHSMYAQCKYSLQFFTLEMFSFVILGKHVLNVEWASVSVGLRT